MLQILPPFRRGPSDIERVFLIWIQSLTAPFTQCSTFAFGNPWVCAQWRIFSVVSRAPRLLLAKLCSISTPPKTPSAFSWYPGALSLSLSLHTLVSVSILLSCLCRLCRSVLLTADFTIYGHSQLPAWQPSKTISSLPCYWLLRAVSAHMWILG